MWDGVEFQAEVIRDQSNDFKQYARNSQRDRDKELLQRQQMTDLKSQVAALRNEVIILKGAMEAMEHDISTTNQRLKNEIRRLERRISKLTANRSRAGGDQFERDYNLALEAHQDGEFSKAEKLFDAFLVKIPYKQS